MSEAKHPTPDEALMELHHELESIMGDSALLRYADGLDATDQIDLLERVKASLLECVSTIENTRIPAEVKSGTISIEVGWRRALRNNRRATGRSAGLRMSYGKLNQALGYPNSVDSGDGKITMLWGISFDDGEFVDIWDYKTSHMPAHEVNRWSVGASSQHALTRLEAILGVSLGQ